MRITDALGIVLSLANGETDNSEHGQIVREDSLERVNELLTLLESNSGDGA